MAEIRMTHLVSIDQLADRLGTSVRHLRRLVAERRIPFVKLGGLVRFDVAEVEAWVDAARYPATGDSKLPPATSGAARSV
jgi:excisionase family DNA binding protein